MGVALLHNRVIDLFPPKKPFARCTWEEISKVCKAGLASECWAIGDTKNMIDGDDTTALRIIGFDHDPVEDAAAYGREKAGITLEMVYVPSELSTPMHTVRSSFCCWYTSYASVDYHSIVRREVFPNYLQNTVPSKLQSVIVPVMKEHLQENAKLTETADTLFILSANEVYGSNSSAYGAGGTHYAYYAAGNSKVNTLPNGTAVGVWLRSKNSSDWFQLISANGTLDKARCDTTGYYAKPCFCI